MTPYGKTAHYAIAAMSRLAEVYAVKQRLSSADIAQSRELPQPIVAKVLTNLSQAGLVAGAPGPGGGYSLARPPAEISLADVARLFERVEDQLTCPFGPNWCGNGPQCPLHEQLKRLREEYDHFLRSNLLAAFAEKPKPAKMEAPPAPKGGLSLGLVPAKKK